MRRYYEYLQDPYQSLEVSAEKRSFAEKVNSVLNQRQYVKITLLTWDEKPIKDIQGVVTSGTLTKDGSSSVRRTMTLSVNIEGGTYDVTSLKMDFSINKKVFVELGVKNDTGLYPQYETLWFPQGVFFITKLSLSASATSATALSLTLSDKMSMLNGDIGGVLPAATTFDSIDTQSETGQYVSKKVTVYELIENVVNHFGGEDLNNILIEDVDLKIRRVVRWNGENNLYLIPMNDKDGNFQWYESSVDLNEDDLSSDYGDAKPDKSGIITVLQGDDCGYVYDDFVYTSDLSLNAGSKVTDVLDKIVSYLGNYEYFYDEYGIFHFREIKNYMNTTFASVSIDEMISRNYLMNTSMGKTAYTFSGESNIISISSNPSFSNIKNDFIVEGKRQSTVSDQSYPVRYHLAIDEKPRKTYLSEDGTYTYEPRTGLVLYKDPDTSQTVAAFPKTYGSNVEGYDGNRLPSVGTLNTVYYVKNFSHQEKGVEKQDGAIDDPIIWKSYENGKDDAGLGLYIMKVPSVYEKQTEGEYAGYWLPTKYKVDLYTYENENDPPQSYDETRKTAVKTRTIKVSTTQPTKYEDSIDEVTGKPTRIYMGYMGGTTLENTKNFTYTLDESLVVTPEYVYWDGEQYQILEDTSTYGEDNPYVPQDWRTELYIEGEYAKTLGTDKGYYYEELASGWPQIYDLEKQKFITQNTTITVSGGESGGETKALSCKAYADGNMFLDFIDATSSYLGEYSVSAIGRRTDVVVDEDVNCLFQPEIPDIVYIDNSLDKEEREKQATELTNKGEKWSGTTNEIYAALATGGYKNGAFDRIKYELYLHTEYQNSLSITAIPAFYLEPNIRVSVYDKTSGIFGDYMIKSISYTLGTGTSMTVSASEIVERF